MQSLNLMKAFIRVTVLAILISACTLVPDSVETTSPTQEPLTETSQPKGITQEPLCQETELNSARFNLDGVEITLCAGFPLGEVFLPAPNDIVQAASSLESSTAPSVFLLAVPYGMTPATEGLPAAQQGISAAWLQTLKKFRQSQNADLFDAANINFFESPSEGILSRVNNEDGTFTLVAEWTAEVGERAWLLRFAKTYPNSLTDEEVEGFRRNFINLFSVTSPDTSRPSISKSLAEKPVSPYVPKEIPGAADLPTPSWWSGTCNVKNHPGSYYLGNSYRGVKACGPIGSAKQVNFGAGRTQLEWQCAEFSKRYLYLAYGIPPYIADGKKMVDNYSGTLLVKIKNSTVGVAPQPGDVLAYGPNTTYGHTSVVSGSFVDSSGNGYITVVEQNYSTSGTRKHTVKNWTVQDNLVITGWLHDPRGSAACTSLFPNMPADGLVTDNPSLTFSWSAPAGCVFSGFTFRIKDTTNMESGGTVVYSLETGETSKAYTLSKEWLNKNLYWGVKAPGTAWVVRSLRVEAQPEIPAPPAAPILLSPANGSAHTNTPQLCWQPGSSQTSATLMYQVSLQGAANLQSGWQPETCFTPDPLAAGTYLWNVTARDENSNMSEASLSGMFVVEEAPVTISASPNLVEIGMPIQVTWSRPNTSNQAWIGMFSINDPDALPSVPEYLSGLSGTVFFQAEQPGTFHFRFFINNTKVAESETVEVFWNPPSDPTPSPQLATEYTPTPQPAPNEAVLSLPFYEKLMEWIDSNFITYFIKQILLEIFNQIR